MTREEAIENLKEFIDTYITCHGEEDTIAVSLDNVDVEAFDMAIKALENELVIDKIRAEIVDLGQRTMNDNRASGIWACRDIIDKYKSERGG